MSGFLKYAFELISSIVYNLVECLAGFFGGLLKLFVTGVPGYNSITKTYFPTLGLAGKILSILLIILLIAIPVVLIFLLIRRIVMRIQLRAAKADDVTLYKEIGRLNKQVLELIDEKNRILALKTGAAGGYIGAAALEDGTIPYVGNVVSGAEGAEGAETVGVAGSLSGNIDASFNDSTISNAAEAMTKARLEAQEKERIESSRFPKLSLVDSKYVDYVEPEFNREITLEEFVENYRLFACSRLHLYYTPEIVRRFVAGMASSRILILEGISGTGKTSLPYSFSRYLNNPATMVSVQPSFRDRTELLGYFNEFSKRFNETEFLRALYEAGYHDDPSFIVLDEMNLARIEYYFAEMLSVLEMPSHDEWVLDLVPTAWPADPVKLHDGKITVPETLWFVGTANNDDSTFTITDKVYDRAMPIEINERADAFECPDTPPVYVSSRYLEALFAKAKEDHPISEAMLAKMVKLDQYLKTRFKLAFGNRIMKQMYDFIPVYVACGGTEVDAMDYILARKVLKKFESQNLSFIRDEIKGLVSYIDKTFGENHMSDSRDYLKRIQNLY